MRSNLMNKSISYHSHSKGFSIVEFLVAGVLGLLLLGGVIQLFLGSNRNYTMQDELATIQENGRFTLMFMQRQLEQAGWFVDSNLQSTNALPVDLNTSLDATNDTIVITYSTAINGIDNIDCNGSAVASGNIVNTFSVVGDDLMCQGNGGAAAQPLIDGVDRFQILYGVESDGACPDGVVNNYLNRNDVVNAGLQDKVVAVRIGLLLRSQGNVLPEPESKEFTVLNLTYNSPSDQFIRRLFQETIFMPNAAYRAIGSPQQIIDCMADSV